MSNYPVKFGKYLLLERVNVGGMAEVFKAKTFGVAGFERILAIKRILPNLVEDDEFIRMFIDEARIAVQLNHANIVQIYELGKHGEHYYIAMEYVASRDLRAILDRMRSNGQLMPITQAAYVCKKVCEGLDYAHKKRDPSGNPMNIIHRDVSPQNILLGYEGEVKVIDFGIAKAANRASKTQAGVLKGKFGYMSPEQVRGLPTDRRSDIFAVGVLLYEMLTGERLFIGESDFSTLERVRNAEVVPPTNFNKKISQELEQIVLKTLAREVEDRFQWSSELAEALEPFLVEDKQVFSMKRLAASLREMYAPEIALEKQKLEEFLRVTADDAKPERGGPATSSILPLHHPTTDPAAPSARTQQKIEEEEEDPAAGFGEDKTFVIEASTAGLQLQNQATEGPQKPQTSQPSGSAGMAPAARSNAGVAAAPKAPQPKIRPGGATTGGAASMEKSSSNTAPKPRPDNTNDDFLEQHSLYGDDSSDADDSRTLVSAPNPYYDPNKGEVRTGEDDDDEIDASEADIEIPQVTPSAGRRLAAQQTTASSMPEGDPLSDAPTQAATRGELEAAREQQRAREREASTRNPPARESTATRTQAPLQAAGSRPTVRPAASAAPTANRGGALDPVAAAMEEEERMAMEVLKGTNGGRSPAPSDASRGNMRANGDVAGGPQLPSPSWNQSSDTATAALQSPPNTPVNFDVEQDDDRADPDRNAPVAVVPPKMMRALIAALAGSFLMFLIVLIVGIVMLTGNSSTLELYALPGVAPPDDLKVTIDGVGSFKLDTVVPLAAEKEHVVTVSGTGIQTITRTVRPTGHPMKQPVMLIAGVAVEKPKKVEDEAVVDTPETPDKKNPDQIAASATDTETPRPVAPPVGGGWRLSLAAVADDTGKPVTGAEIWVDGQLYGRTPLEAELDPALDKIVIRVKKDGFMTREVPVGRDGRDRVGPATVRLMPRGAVEAQVDTPSEPAGTPDKVAVVKTEEKPVEKPAVEKKAPVEKPVANNPVEKKAKQLSPIQIGTQPFADTVIDGRKYGSTPFYGPRKLDLTVGKHKVEFTDKANNKKYRFEINILAPDPENKIIIVLGKGDPPRVTGKMQAKILP